MRLEYLKTRTINSQHCISGHHTSSYRLFLVNINVWLNKRLLSLQTLFYEVKRGFISIINTYTQEFKANRLKTSSLFSAKKTPFIPVAGSLGTSEDDHLYWYPFSFTLKGLHSNQEGELCSSSFFISTHHANKEKQDA